MLNPERAIQIEQTAINKGIRLKRENFEKTTSYELTLQDMLPNMKDVHGLLSFPLAASIYDSDFFSVYSAAYKDNVFFGSRLVDLLDTTRPKNRIKEYDYGQGRWGTLADWKETNERLLNDHSIDLEPYWSEFMDFHKTLFIEAMTAFHPEEIETFFKYRIPTIANIKVNTERRPDMEPIYSNDYTWGRNSIKEQDLGHNRYKIFLRDSWIELRLDPDGTVVEIERYIHDQEDKGIIPHFAWVHVKNTNQRLYLSSQVPDWITEGLDPRSNTYLGLTVAKHLSGVKFPFREKLSTRHNPQGMREAQIVMQASKRRSEIMPFFSTFEEFIRTRLQAN